MEVWCLLIDHEKKAAFGDPFSVIVGPDARIQELKKKVKEERTNDLEHVDAARLTVWRCMNPKLLAAFGDPFSVIVGPDARIQELKKKIKEEQPDVLGNVAPRVLTVWRCMDPKLLAEMDLEQLEKDLSNVDFTDRTKTKMLAIRQKTTELALSPSEEILLIEVPDLNELRQVVSAKRMRDEGDLSVQIERFKKQQIVEIAPSTLATTYSTIQGNSQQRILDDIPNPDTDVSPVSLLFDGFGEFLDTFRTYDGLPVNVASIPRGQCHSLIDDFAEKMCLTYPDEDRRNRAGLEAINKIFVAYGINNATFGRALIDKVISDGHFLTEHKTVGGVVEFKNSGSGTGGIHIQMVGYAARGRAEALGGPNKELMLWRAPCMGISVVDTWVGFYAILFVDSRARAVSLTPWLSCCPSGGEGDQRSALYAAFAAATVLIRRITEDASIPDINRHADMRFPYISHLPTEGGSSNEPFSFRIVCRFGPWRDSRLLFMAETNDGREIIVKFSRQYSIDLHRFCAVRHHAPKLLGHKKLPGGWFAVAMDLIAPVEYLAKAEITQEKRDSLKSIMRDLVDSFHAEGLVHGDLRGPNILYNGETVILVDFDWGGKDGEVSYPTVQLCEELMAGRNISDLKIRKQDDLRILQRTLDSM
ncbi:hypothetical protein A7U60_g7787 [Sanghuangporus baumii]|uniref:non-specific serine/threonine protein kinase n=1 Tax=Sanghuangporus baumii TaxID=108892 RepID=A0A9Q5HSL1_SANBA|nr:hypothetical protein A7U60_g7787 [Sanghuangporus baumii]